MHRTDAFDYYVRPATACGYRWTAGPTCSSGDEHVCWRTTPEHRTHLCTCEAIRLRVAPHVRLSS